MRERVSARLEELSGPGALLDFEGARATERLYEFDASRDLILEEVESEYLMRQPRVSAQGRCAVVTAGPPGAGKSAAVRESGRVDDQWRVIDADVIKEMLLRRAITDHIFDDLLALTLPDGRPLMPLELAGLVHAESTKIADDLRVACAFRGEDIVIEGTLNWDGQADAILTDLEGNGYEALVIVDVEVPRTTAQEQVLTRWWDARLAAGSGDLGGRFVPTSAIDAMYLTGGTTTCATNARTMFESDAAGRIAEVRLIVHDRAHGEPGSDTSERVRVDGVEVT